MEVAKENEGGVNSPYWLFILLFGYLIICLFAKESWHVLKACLFWGVGDNGGGGD